MLGTHANAHLAGYKQALGGTFASVVIAVGLYAVGLYIVVSGLLQLRA